MIAHPSALFRSCANCQGINLLTLASMEAAMSVVSHSMPLFLQFMKRTKEQQELDIENEERQEMFKNEISDAMKAHG